MQELAGRVAVVTGAGSGMGRAFALRFAAEGMKIVAADIQRDALESTVAELGAGGHDVMGLDVDVADPASVRRLAEQATARFGAVHLLCNNAGVEGYLDGPIWEATDKDWAWTVSVNFWSVVHGIRAFVPLMLGHGEPAHIVNTCSMTSVIRAGNMYGITKHAVLALTEVLDGDLRAAGARIGVTALCPGIIATNLFRGSRNRPPELRNDPDHGPIGPNSAGADSAGPDQADPDPADPDSADTDPASIARERARQGHDRQGHELRERMHATLAQGMPPAEVAAKLVHAIRGDVLYLLTDHHWDDRIRARHESVMAGVAEDGTGASPRPGGPPGSGTPGSGTPHATDAEAAR
jgi:NAD(P)-dependent dehydrogenase (short-subunit alcohol dehydrogenase family)